MIDDRVAFVLMKLGHLAAQRDRDAYLRGVVELCSQATAAERRLPIGRGLAGHSAATGETINVPDAYADPRFDRNVDHRTGFKTVNALVVPVWGSDERTIVGVIQVLNKNHGTFERRDQMLLERIAKTVGPMLAQIQT